MSGIPPFHVLRAKPLWIANGVITGGLALLFAVFYVGANVDPVHHLTKLPVGLVNADKGAAVEGKQVDFGTGITESIKKPATSGHRRCPASTASSRHASPCGRSPAASARSSTTTPRATRV